MNYYLIAKFIHIIGALGFFAALGVEWFGLRHTLHAITAEQVREQLHLSNSAHKLGMPSMLLTVITGIYMTATTWGLVAWIITALAALVLLIVLALTLTGPRMKAIGQALSTENGPISARLNDLLHDSVLWLSARMRLSMALGIVFLMTVKPNLAGSLLTIVVTLLLGLAAGWSMPSHGREQKELAQ